MRRRVKRGIQMLGVALMLIAAYITFEMQTGNFHEVIQGEFYRAAQPEGAQLERYINGHGIKSVINLRGENANAPWYQEEVATSKRLGVKHIDFRMKAARELTNEQAMELIEVMRNAPKPLLVHCRAGADRTGLASAIYVAAIAKGSEWDADYQLSLRYGHIPLWFTKAAAMRRTFERLEPVFGYTGT